jgi:hypothetical protein
MLQSGCPETAAAPKHDGDTIDVMVATIASASGACKPLCTREASAIEIGAMIRERSPSMAVVYGVYSAASLRGLLAAVGSMYGSVHAPDARASAGMVLLSMYEIIAADVKQWTLPLLGLGTQSGAITVLVNSGAATFTLTVFLWPKLVPTTLVDCFEALISRQHWIAFHGKLRTAVNHARIMAQMNSERAEQTTAHLVVGRICTTAWNKQRDWTRIRRQILRSSQLTDAVCDASTQTVLGPVVVMSAVEVDSDAQRANESSVLDATPLEDGRGVSVRLKVVPAGSHNC